MRAVGLLVLLLLTAGSAAAQSRIPLSRYYPLGIGDVWVYEHREGSYEGQSGSPPFLGYVRREVARDTLIEGEPHALIKERRLDPDFEVESEILCVVRATDETFSQTPESCLSVQFSYLYSNMYERAEQEVEIGGATYGVDAEREYGFGHCGSGGTTCQSEWSSFATDIGLLNSGYDETYCSGGECSGSGSTRILIYAEVAGQTYGSFPPPEDTPAEEEEPRSGLFIELDSVYPNPFTDAVTVSVRAPALFRITVDVYDVLGRRVLARELRGSETQRSEHRLDLGGLPAGVYQVRVTSVTGQWASRSVTKVGR